MDAVVSEWLKQNTTENFLRALLGFRRPTMVRIGNIEVTHLSAKAYHIDAVAEGFNDIQQSVRTAQGKTFCRTCILISYPW